MSFSRQSLLGLAILLGGGIMLFAMVQQVKKPDTPEELTVELTTEDGKPISHGLKVEPLTTDTQTEAKLLEQKERQRQARVQQQQIKTEAFIKEQEAAEKRALAKARAENEEFKSAAEPINDIETESTVDTITRPVVTTREVSQKTNQTTEQKAPENTEAKTTVKVEPVTVDAKPEPKPEPKKEVKAESKPEPKPEAKKAPVRSGKYEVKKGDSLTAVASRHNVPVAALAQANKLSSTSMLQVGQKLRIPSANQIAQLEKDAAYLETKRKQAAKAEADKKAAQERKSTSARQTAQQKLKQARQEAKATDAKGTFGVQVALAGNKEKADEIVKKFRSAGYKVKTSQTDRGVRIIVGPERGKVAALALKDKINSDPRVNTTSAWVLYWR
ncbi:LysM peptidoglycan-binding domain-containing protein [Psychrobacter sp. HD31]|uniref:LysM peptidoglycan-binding domain-containing protein n=1 Tax=Psychrobacter sp. HD31 TaxID=3112003 RepID=UPI003DA5235B